MWAAHFKGLWNVAFENNSRLIYSTELDRKFDAYGNLLRKGFEAEIYDNVNALEKMILLQKFLWPHFGSGWAKETVYPPPSQMWERLIFTFHFLEEWRGLLCCKKSKTQEMRNKEILCIWVARLLLTKLLRIFLKKIVSKEILRGDILCMSGGGTFNKTFKNIFF